MFDCDCGTEFNLQPTIKSDFVMPESPEGYHPAAIYDGDGWTFHWQNEDGDCLGFIEPQPWPFVEDQASEDDLERAGFEVC